MGANMKVNKYYKIGFYFLMLSMLHLFLMFYELSVYAQTNSLGIGWSIAFYGFVSFFVVGCLLTTFARNQK
jgi:hypothetical protein